MRSMRSTRLVPTMSSWVLLTMSSVSTTNAVIVDGMVESQLSSIRKASAGGMDTTRNTRTGIGAGASLCTNAGQKMSSTPLTWETTIGRRTIARTSAIDSGTAFAVGMHEMMCLIKGALLVSTAGFGFWLQH